MSSEKKYFLEIRKTAKEYKKKLDKLNQGGDYDTPLDTDMIKTTKAMFYEEVVELMYKYKREKESEE